MSSPTTGPGGLNANTQTSKYISIRWGVDASSKAATGFKVYRIAGLERSGLVIKCDGELLATVSENLFVDIFRNDEGGIYSYTVTAIDETSESKPADGLAIFV